MVRVVYRFRVDPDRMEEFCNAWRQATEMIKAGREGARGSTLLVSADEPSEVLLFALWESREHWQRSRGGESIAPEQEAIMLDIGRPEGHTVYEVVEDLSESIATS